MMILTVCNRGQRILKKMKPFLLVWIKVLLQVVLVNLYGPGGQLNKRALLEPGNTCSLVI